MRLSIRRNAALKGLSLLLAIVGWAYFRFADNPLVAAARFDQQLSVPIAAVNLSPGYIARFGDRQAVVTVEPKSGEPPLKSGQVKAVVDLSNRSPGVYNVPVQLVSPNITVQSLSPASVTLTVERIEAETFPVAMHYAGQANVVVRAFTLSPSTVIVRGPSSDLAQIAAVRVDMPLQSDRPAIDEMIRPQPVTSSGSLIGDVQVIPNLIRVRAQLLPATGTAR